MILKVTTPLIVLMIFLTAACSTSKGVQSKPFSFSSVVKSDIDMVAETHLEATLAHLQKLAHKLYKRNPNQWRQGGYASREQAVLNIFRAEVTPHSSEVAIAHIKQAFDDSYGGDRVQLFISGLRGMTLAAYNDHQEFFILDELDAQKLYNCARNFEVAAWLLRSRFESKGVPYLLNNEIGTVHNLSFERLFGKMIAEHDMIAQIIANKNNRRIKNAIQTMVFLPI